MGTTSPRGTKPFEIACQDITSLSFHPDGRYFVTGDRSGFLCQWSAIDRWQVSLWTVNTKEQINAVAVSTDGRWIISGGAGNKVTIWSTETRERVIEVAEHTGAIYALDISNDSTRFASGSADTTVRVFDIASGTRLIPPLEPVVDKVVGVKFSPDASRIAVTTIATSFWSYLSVYDTLSAGNCLFQISIQKHWWEPITPPAWSFDGIHIFFARPGNIICVNTSTWSKLDWGDAGDNSQQSSIATNSKFVAHSTGSSISFRDSASREQICQPINHAKPIISIAISHDGRRLACVHDSGITVHGLEAFIPEDYLPGILCLPLMRVSITVLKSWVQGNPTETEAILSDETTQRSNPTHDSLAICALVRTHLGEWRTALETSEMSLQIKASPIGQIARSIALIGAGEHEAALDELDLVFHDCDLIDNKILLVVNSILIFMCNKRKEAISHLRYFIAACGGNMKDVYLQVLGMMYLKQGDYGNAVETLGVVENAFTNEDRGSLMTLFIIFNWNFENIKSIAWQRACENLYAIESVKEVGNTLLKMIRTLPEDEKECAHSRILEQIITRSSDVTLLAWTGKSSTCNSCLPNSPAVYSQTQLTLLSLELEREELNKRITELRTTFLLLDALLAHCSVTHSQVISKMSTV